MLRDGTWAGGGQWQPHLDFITFRVCVCDPSRQTQPGWSSTGVEPTSEVLKERLCAFSGQFSGSQALGNTVSAPLTLRIRLCTCEQLSEGKLLAWCVICNGNIKYNIKIQFAVQRGSLSCPAPSGIDCVVCVERTLGKEMASKL